MSSPTVDYILGDALRHAHKAGDITDLTTTLDPRYVNITGDTMTGGLTIQPATDTLTALVVNDKDSNNVLTVDTINNRVGIGVTSPGYPLDISASQTGLRLGADSTLTTRTNSTAKASVLCMPHYLTAEEDVGIYLVTSNNGYNTFNFGGGSSGKNAATYMLFYTAADGTTVTGTERMRIDNVGNVGIGTTSPGEKLEVNGKIKFSTSGGITMTTENDNGGFKIGSSASTNGSGFRMLPYQDNIWFQNTYSAGDIYFSGLNGDNLTGDVIFNTSGNVGIGTTAPTNILSLGGNSARIFWLERHTTANTAGNTLTVTAGGATSGATDKAGGALILQGGLSTGSAESGVTIQGCVAGATGTTDGTQATMIQVLGNKIGFFTATPVVQQTELTDELTTITFTAPGTPDYAIQDLIDSSVGATFGFATKDEGNSVLAVIANLQARVNELETKLVAYGLLIDAD